jgi:hypothetical protein
MGLLQYLREAKREYFPEELKTFDEHEEEVRRKIRHQEIIHENLLERRSQYQDSAKTLLSVVSISFIMNFFKNANRTIDSKS